MRGCLINFANQNFMATPQGNERASFPCADVPTTIKARKDGKKSAITYTPCISVYTYEATRRRFRVA